MSIPRMDWDSAKDLIKVTKEYEEHKKKCSKKPEMFDMRRTDGGGIIMSCVHCRRAFSVQKSQLQNT
jgi:hypothetical protein